jgi:hypothetical protein
VSEESTRKRLDESKNQLKAPRRQQTPRLVDAAHSLPGCLRTQRQRMTITKTLKEGW